MLTNANLPWWPFSPARNSLPSRWGGRLRPTSLLAMLGIVVSVQLFSVSPASGGNTVGATVQNAATANGNGSSVTLFGTFLVATYTVSGTFVATVNFEGTGPTGVFEHLGCVPLTGGAVVSTTTTTGGWRCNVVNFIQIRARISSYTSGAVTVGLQASDAGSVLIGPPVDSASPSTATVLIRQLDPADPVLGSVWLSLTTANTVKYFEGAAIRSLVDLSLTQTLSGKTLSSPTLSGTVTGTPTWASGQTFPSLALTSPLPASSGGTGLNTTGATGTPHLTALTGWSIGDVRVESYAILPSPQSPGRLAYRHSDVQSLQLDTGLRWLQLDDLTSATTLTNKTLVAPILSGVTTGTYTLGGTVTVASPTVTGTVSGNYILANPSVTGTVSGLYTLASPGLIGTVTGTPVWARGQTFPFVATTASPPQALPGDLVLMILPAAGLVLPPGFGALTLRARRSLTTPGMCALWAIGGAAASETLIKDRIQC